jgi:poly(A) polymerase
MRFPNQFIDEVAGIVGNHMRFMDVTRMRRATLRRLAGAPLFDLELELHRADCLASHGSLDNHEFLRDFREAMKSEPVLPPPFLNGHDLLALGMSEGPSVGKTLREAYELQLEGRLGDRAAALEWARTRVADR